MDGYGRDDDYYLCCQRAVFVFRNVLLEPVQLGIAIFNSLAQLVVLCYRMREQGGGQGGEVVVILVRK